MRNISFTVPGEPRGKARPKVTRTKTGKSLTYTPDKTVAYEELVRQRYLQASGGQKFSSASPLIIFVRAFYGIPKSYTKRQRSKIIKGDLLPTKKPDFDNVFKILCDALNGIAYDDDAQIVRASFRKNYTEGSPHVEVSLFEYTAGVVDRFIE